jgi:hypothetical protein
LAHYDRAYTGCLEARDYTVKLGAHQLGERATGRDTSAALGAVQIESFADNRLLRPY